MLSVYRGCNVILLFFLACNAIVAREPYMKYILQWSPPHGKPELFLGEGTTSFITNHCTYTNCYVTDNKNLFRSVTLFDAIIFDTIDIHKMMEDDFPKERNIYQKYILSATESSRSMPICKMYLNNFFNWTWTYKLSSDLPRTFFTVYYLLDSKQERIGDEVAIGPKWGMEWMRNTLHVVPEAVQKMLLFKNNAAAWFVDECKTFSKREILAYEIRVELRNLGFDVDIFGTCGGKNCSAGDRKCADMLRNDYYFYFAFESYLATDYVTDIVLTALDNYVVPVVYGGADYSNFLPPNSYLDASKQDPAATAKRMVELISNPREYHEYFWWRSTYSIKKNSMTKTICELCAMMNDRSLLTDHSYYGNIRRFFNEETGRCYWKM